MCMCIFNVSTEGKDGVLKKGKHQIVVDNQPVTIFLEPNENAKEKKTKMSSSTQSQKGARHGEKPPDVKDIHNATDSCLQKVGIEGSYVCSCNFLSSPRTIC